VATRVGDRDTVPEAPATTDLGQAYGEVVPQRRSLLRHATTPVVVALALGALYLYISGQQLDSIERRRLNWEFISASTLRHVEIAVIATVVVGLLAVPAGILLTRPFSRPVRPVILGFANLGQAVPSIGVIALLTIIWTIGLRTAIVALVAYAFLPILRNTMVGLQQVNPSIIEAGRGMGMTRRGVLARIELPLAVPVILAGVRTALVITVGTAALATFINAGGLGDIINYGLVQNRFSVTLTGGALTAALAVLIDWVAGIAEDLLRPRGL
jgi:osmoprotectant transport system permease protein